MSTPDLSRKRVPMGGADRLLLCPSECLAGHTWLVRIPEPGPVKRIAWVTRPEASSSYRVRPGRIAKPAASAEVQPSGRSWLVSRLNTAPFAAVHDPSARG